MLPALKESARHIPLVQIRAPLIEIRALAKSYGKGGAPEVQVLESLDLNVAPGEFLAVMGPSGSGTARPRDRLRLRGSRWKAWRSPL